MAWAWVLFGGSSQANSGENLHLGWYHGLMTSRTFQQSSWFYTAAVATLFAVAISAMYLINIKADHDRVLLGIANARIVGAAI